MQLGTRGHYAVLALSDLARRGNLAPVNLAAIAGAQKIPRQYLEQIFARLRRGGLVHARRGQGGGYVLARKPEDIKIDEIFRIVGEPMRFTRCRPGEAGCLPGARRCLNHHLWVSLGRQLAAYLQSIRLSDVAQGNHHFPQLRQEA